MKIAFVSNFVEPTGGDNILYHHASGLSRLGHKVDAYFRDFLSPAKEHNEDWNSQNVNLILYEDPDGKLLDYDWDEYDIVVANGLHGASFVRYIDHPNKAWFCQNFDPYVFPGNDRDKAEIDKIYQYYDKYLTYSHDLGKIIQYYYGKKQIIHCNNGIDYKAFEPYQKKGKDYETLESYENTEVGKNKRVCFMVAYYRDYKGIKFANEVFGILKDRGYTTVEINATVGPLENTMEFHKNPSFEDKCKIIASCGTMMHPSVFETWGLVPMESMALGVPVVGVNSRGIMEYAEKGNSLIYDDRKSELVVGGIRMLSEKGHDVVYEDIQRKGIETAKDHDWDTIMPEIEKSYEELIG